MDFFQKITAAHHPEAACSIVALAHKTDAIFLRNLQIFFGMHKFLLFFSLGCEIYSQETSKSGGIFAWKSLSLERKASRYNEKPKKHKIFKKPQNFFRKHKFLKFLFDLAELPMVSLGQEPLGGANHSQKTSKSGGAFQPSTYFNKKSHSVEWKHKQITKSVKKFEILTKVHFLIDSYYITGHQ